MKNYALEIKWAIIFTIVSLLWMVMEKLVGLHDTYIDKHAFYTNFFIFPAIFMVVKYMKEKKNNEFGGTMTFKQGFIGGMILTLLIVILSPLAQWITNTVITPDYFENAINYAVENNKATEEQARSFFNPTNYMMMSAFGAAIMGTITSAAVAFFMRSK